MVKNRLAHIMQSQHFNGVLVLDGHALDVVFEGLEKAVQDGLGLGLLFEMIELVSDLLNDFVGGGDPAIPVISVGVGVDDFGEEKFFQDGGRIDELDVGLEVLVVVS